MMRKAIQLAVALTTFALAPASLAQNLAADTPPREPEPTPPEEPSSSPSDVPIDVVVMGDHAGRADDTADTKRVGAEALRASPKPTLLEALAQAAPDVYVSARGAGIHGVAQGATGGVHIRGMGGSPNTQIVVIEDGVPDYQGIFGHPIPDAYAPFLLDEAVIVRGGDSVLYGTNAMGGAILLRSRWRRGEGWEVESDSALGSYDTMRESISLLGRSGRYDVAGNVYAMRSDGHRLGAGGSSLIGQLALRARPGSGWELTLRQKGMHLTGADPGPVTHPNDGHTYDVWRERVSLHANWSSKVVDIRARAFFNRGRHALYDGFLSTDTTRGLIVESVLALNRTVELLIGAAADRADGTAGNRITEVDLPMRPRQTAAWYDQVTIEPVKGLLLIGGTRVVASAGDALVFLYKGGVRWSFAEGWALRARTASNYRQPTLNELYLPFPTANPDLKPERSRSADAGIGYRGSRLTFSASAYRNDAYDLIKYFGAWPAAEVVNIDHATVVGVESQVVVRDLGPVTVRAGGNWQDVGRYTKQNPSARGVLGVEVAQPVGAWIVRTALEGEWVHGLFMSNYGEDPIDDVYVLNLGIRARRELLERSLLLEPYVAVRNLLDRRYAYVRDYTMPGFNALSGLRLVL